MADKKTMLPPDEAQKRAARVRELKPGFVITLRVDVALALMKQRDLEFNRWLSDGNILEVRKIVKTEEAGESNAIS